ncbi:hypothetical protein N7488_009648 [Penicillium malachiteum]|nr:hypothetical protein N7488_009648 [Penicillium malachiteum]
MTSTTSISFGDQNQAFQVGISHGPIYYTAASASEQPEPRPEPLSTVPFPHDPDFVSRDELLDQIHEKSSIQGSRIVLVGLGGVGKSRLAIEHCHRVRQESPDTWVFWVHASNAARCEESLRNLADCAKIPGRQDRESNIFQLFGNWLQDGKVGKWILVLDNVDDDELLQKPLSTWTDAQENTQRHVPTQPPLRYLLASSNGSIIVTSRNRAVALEIADHKKNLIDVLPMNSTDALLLLQNKLDESAEKQELVQLVEELEFMPLAITQAASYINHRSPQFSASQYLGKLRQSDRQATKLLEHEGKHMHRDWEAKNSILRTWQISFDHIRRIRKSAADLLSLMSFFDWQGIQRIFYGSSDEDTDSSSESEGDDEFEHDIMILKDYSFITSGKDSTSTVFTMHRLVQLTAHLWLKTNEQEEEWKSCFIKNLYRAWYATEYGSISVAEDMAAMSMKQRIKMYGVENEEALDSTAILAKVYEQEGRWEEAEQLNMQVLKTRKMKLGAEDLSTLKSMNSLALIYRKQGRWEDAEQLQLHVMETRKIKLGADHPDTLLSMANLAFTWEATGQHSKAIDLLRACVAKEQQFLGPTHPDTVSDTETLLRWETAHLNIDA